MRNLKVFIAYNGAAYLGFQRQDNALTARKVTLKSTRLQTSRERRGFSSRPLGSRLRRSPRGHSEKPRTVPSKMLRYRADVEM